MNPMIAGSLISAGGNLLGGLLGGASDLLATDSQNKAAAAEAEKNRAFQKSMDSTKYQRAFDDLRKAGMNPMAMMSTGAVSGGNLSGSTAQMGKSNIGDITQRAIQNAVSSALNNQQIKNQKKAVDSQAQLNISTAEKTQAEAENIRLNSERERFELAYDKFLNMPAKHLTVFGKMGGFMSKQAAILRNSLPTSKKFKRAKDQINAQFRNWWSTATPEQKRKWIELEKKYGGRQNVNY